MTALLRVHLLLMAAAVIVSLPFYGFSWYLTLHILGAVLFMGGIVSTTVWVAMAQFSRDAGVMHFASKTARAVDLVVIAPSVVLVLLSGLVMTVDRWGGWGGFHEYRWIETALTLFVIAAVIWAVFLRRYQSKLESLSGQAVQSKSPLDAAYDGALRRWYFWSSVTIAISIAILYLMAAKPWL